EVTLEGERMHFSFNTRTFMIHEPTLDGRWQDAWQVTGPQRGGIFGFLELRQGKYEGQAIRPCESDKRYFTALWLAPESARHDCHLDVLLRSPHDVPKGFVAEFRQLVGNFETYYLPLPRE